MIFEVIAHNLTDVKHAKQYGADRIELVQSMVEGGITPSYGLIKKAVESVDTKINVIIRPHNKSFVYTEDDMEEMLADIAIVKQLGANGIVIGPMTQDGKVNEAQLQRLLEQAEGLDVTFHRGIDVASDQFEALETIMKYKQITTILTSGGTDRVTDMNSNIKKLVKKTKGTHLTIMPGSGVHLETLQSFVADIHPGAIHIGSGIRTDNSFNENISEEKMKIALDIIRE